MKILQLDLRAFGPFTSHTLDLSGGDHGLHLVYGPNEAGKSSTLRALKQMLYGIPGSSADNFIHPFPKLRVGATLKHSDGSTLSFLRRKGTKNTLLETDGKTSLPDSELAPYLGGISQDVFTTMFGIDHQSLVDGGHAIVEGQGELGQVLFLAGSGISHLKEVQKQLKKECDDLFKPGGSVPAINKAMREWKQHRTTIRETELSSDEWSRLDETQQQQLKRKQEVEEELTELHRQHSRLSRIQLALPEIAEWKNQQSQFEQYRDTVELPEDFTRQRTETQTELQIARNQLITSQRKITTLTETLQQLNPDETLLTHTERVKDFQDQLGSHRKAMSDRKDRVAERLSAQKDAEHFLQDLGSDISLDHVERYRLKPHQRVRIQELAQERQATESAVTDTSRRCESIERERDSLQQRLAEFPAKVDLQPLKEAIAQTLPQGGLEEHRDTLADTLTQNETKTSQNLKRLPGWSGSLSELTSLAVPSLEAIEHDIEQFAGSGQQVEHLRQQVDDAEEKQRSLNQQWERLKREGEVPTEEQLQFARKRREQLWQEVKQSWLQVKETGQSIGAAAANEFVFGPDQEDLDLAAMYKAAVDEADRVADQLRRDATRVEQHAQLQRECTQQEEIVARLREQLAIARAADQELHSEWEQKWLALSVTPQPPKAMRAWLSRQQELIEQESGLQQQRRELRLLEEKIETHRERLQDCLAEFAADNAESPQTLKELLSRAQTLVQSVEQTNQQRDRVIEQTAELEREFPESKQQQQVAKEAWEQWQQEWATAMQQLDLPPETTANQANTFISSLDECLRELREVESLTERIEGIDADAAAFQQEVAEFCQSAFPELVETPIEQAVEVLVQQAERARNERERQADLQQQREQEQTTAEQTQSEVDRLEIRLQEFCRTAQCDRIEELPEIEQDSRRKQQISDRIVELELQILKSSAGAPLEEFIRDAETVDADTLSPQLKSRNEQIHALETEHDELIDAIATVRSELNRMDGSEAAARAAEDAENIAAQLATQIEQYARVKLASDLLKRGMERYREKHQGPVLERASELFAQLTLGSFSGLTVDFDESLLVGLREGSEHQVSLQGMSEGTCDQLYLALRLAGLDTYLTDHEAMPFIVDDVLVNFDNERTIAALQAFAELSSRTQVIFFTHHEHLVDLAQEHLSSDVLHTHLVPTCL